MTAEQQDRYAEVASGRFRVSPKIVKLIVADWIEWANDNPEKQKKVGKKK